jgi:hypothetical protein
MAVKVYNLTLTGSAQRATTTHIPLSQLHIESETGNGAVYIGDSTVAADDYGMTVTAGSANAKAIGPFPAGWMNLDEIYFLGTEDDVIHLTAITP